MIRGRRPKETRPCPRLFNFNPFRVDDRSVTDVLTFSVQPTILGNTGSGVICRGTAILAVTDHGRDAHATTR